MKVQFNVFNKGSKSQGHINCNVSQGHVKYYTCPFGEKDFHEHSNLSILSFANFFMDE